MKREIAAVALLLAMLAGSFVNLSYCDSLTEEIKTELALSRDALEDEDFAKAREHGRAACEQWLSAKKYTHIFIRHQEVDSTSEAFFDLIQLLDEENASAAASAYDKLVYHLESNDGMEHPRLGSVF